MFLNHIQIHFCKNKIMINNNLICSNWYELIHDISLKSYFIKNCKNKNIIININNEISISKNEIIKFFTNNNLKIIKIYKNNNLIFKAERFNNTKYLSIIFLTILLSINIYLNILIVENNRTQKNLQLIKNTLIKQTIEKNNKTKSRISTFNSKYSILKNLDCVIEKIIFKKNNVSITFISIKNIETQTQDNKEIIPVLITDIGGIYEINFNY